jgi:hypothetical protein
VTHSAAWRAAARRLYGVSRGGALHSAAARQGSGVARGAAQRSVRVPVVCASKKHCLLSPRVGQLASGGVEIGRMEHVCLRRESSPQIVWEAVSLRAESVTG